MKREISFKINGQERELQIDIRQSLSEVLRENGLTSVKESCGVGECGSCTVLIDGKPVDSCLTLAVRAHGRAIRTAEGEANGDELSKVQQAYINQGAVQCGFCTPGLIMATTAFVEGRKGKPADREEIKRAHAGNLCRCTGYEHIIRAVEESLED